MDDTTTIGDRYLQAHQALTEVLDAVDAAAWDQPSPCDGWSARDVVGHLIETQRSFLVDRGVLDAATPAPDAERDPADAWRAHVEVVRPVVSDAELMATEYDGYFGPTTVGDSLGQFYVFDMIVHRWDVATATGVGTSFDEKELDGIEAGAASWGDALYMEGICAPAVEVAPGADRTDRVLAMLGRRA